ncbi:hypothetical protein, partial [Acetobacter orientalis]|uniref:hypothetical protein n=1 Tax=Acetobacter orientalis TaxID=146474 RepID=UPI001C5BA929
LKIRHHPTGAEKFGNALFWVSVFKSAKIPQQDEDIYKDLVVSSVSRCLTAPSITIVEAAREASESLSIIPLNE